MKNKTIILLLLTLGLSMTHILKAQTGIVKLDPTKLEKKAPKTMNERLLKRIWWNNPKRVELINLSREQRNKMDVFLVEFLNKNKVIKQKQKDERKALGLSFTENNKANSNELSEKIANLFHDSVKNQIDMMGLVILELSIEQKQIINEKLPKLFSSFWVRGGISGGIKNRKPRTRKVKVTKK